MKYLLVLFISIGFISCKTEAGKDVKTAQQAAADSANYTTVQYLDSEQNMGVLTMGDEAQVTFDFKNTGKKPLYIISAEPSCGCTVADYPKEPIAPDSLGKIVAVFDTKKGAVGVFSKVITVITNSKPADHALVFSGEVISKGGEATTADSSKAQHTPH